MRKINFGHKTQGMFFIVDSKMVIVLVFIFSVVTTIDFGQLASCSYSGSFVRAVEEVRNEWRLSNDTATGLCCCCCCLLKH